MPVMPVKLSANGVCQASARSSGELLTATSLGRLQRNLATVAQVQPKPTIFRTDEAEPAKHNDVHHGLFYTIPNDTASLLFVLGGFDKEQQLMLKTFRETSIMVRKPALEIINYLNKTDFNKPPNRYVLYGPIGSGKTYTLNHLLHYGFSQKFVLIYCSKPTDWTKFPQEYSASSENPKRIDTPLDAAVWLQHFKAQNLNLLEELKLTSLNKYTWSLREHTNPGDSLMSIVEHGINRIKHASDCMAVLLKELKLNSEKGNCRLLVVADKANAFYEPTLLRFPDRTCATADDITIARAFKKLFKKDWQNGAVVASVCKKLVVPYRIFPIHGLKNRRERERVYKHWGPFNVDHISDYPRDLLTDEGFHDFDPFVPIEVEKYSDKEMVTCLEYYQDRRWLQRPAAFTEEGREEIKFLSGANPFHVYEFCSSL
ncbi:PREDICTED: 28S ribosomal protein S29, mitochondrial-like [Rhagoletis zephyria]|uniref:28S ribosomal protein S29, mitochondrial-like n=1 Tax=Rhagoletis zephyria TaxID=28612 RepID=UPI000811A991|nr:PREDICTED: 28S ribosomal protein S29, mitochondrial-like [Rhagoletis zephyria]